jgi:hypothetical protein
MVTQECVVLTLGYTRAGKILVEARADYTCTGGASG